MKTTLALVLALTLSGCGFFKSIQPPPQPAPKPEEPSVTVHDVLRNTVGLADMDGDLYCSGVAVEGIILTAYHCIDKREFQVLYGGTFYPGVAVVGWKTHDLALVDAIGAKMKGTLEVSPWEPEYGMKVVWTGYPLGDPTKRVFAGIVAAPLNLREHTYFDIDGQMIPGNSGGPVVDERGRLIGIVSATAVFLWGAPHIVDIGHAIRPAFIREILNPNRKH